MLGCYRCCCCCSVFVLIFVWSRTIFLREEQARFQAKAAMLYHPKSLRRRSDSLPRQSRQRDARLFLLPSLRECVGSRLSETTRIAGNSARHLHRTPALHVPGRMRVLPLIDTASKRAARVAGPFVAERNKPSASRSEREALAGKLNFRLRRPGPKQGSQCGVGYICMVRHGMGWDFLQCHVCRSPAGGSVCASAAECLPCS